MEQQAKEAELKGEELQKSVKGALDHLSVKLQRIEETAKIKKWVSEQIEQVFDLRKQEIDMTLLQLDSEVQACKRQFRVPGVIGETEIYDDFADFVKQTYEESKVRKAQIDNKMHEL